MWKKGKNIKILFLLSFFLKSHSEESKCQTPPANSSPPEHNGIRDSSIESQSQRSPDGSEDGDSSQSRNISRRTASLHGRFESRSQTDPGSVQLLLFLLFILGAKLFILPDQPTTTAAFIPAVIAEALTGHMAHGINSQTHPVGVCACVINRIGFSSTRSAAPLTSFNTIPP